MFKECIHFAKENHSELYDCFLDVQKALDKNWHYGWLFKLYQKGIHSNLLQIITNLHKNMTSRVVYNGHYSVWLPILQGARQCGFVSHFMYLCNSDDLINEICRCVSGFMLLGLVLCVLAVADDMMLLSLSKNGRDMLMRICYQYSCKWRFDYVPVKCSVFVFNEAKFVYDQRKRQLRLGPHIVNEDMNYKHSGVNYNKYLSIDINLKEAANKFKGAFLTLVNCGLIHSESLHPLSCKKIYESVFLPKALYGCKLGLH